MNVPEAPATTIIDLVLDRLNAPTSKAMYRRALPDFLAWYEREAAAAFDKATVQRYRATLLEARLAPSTINQKLTAICALASESADNACSSRSWLTQVDAQRLLDAPDPPILLAGSAMWSS